jgi:ABC-type methionine transport system ATPase subunit
MLNVNNVLPTPYKDRKMKILWLRFTHQMIFDRKRTVERRNNFQNKMCVSSQNKRVRKEEGATVDFVGHFVTLPFLSAAERSTGWTGSVLHGRIQTIGKLPLTTSNVLPSTPAIFSLN